MSDNENLEELSLEDQKKAINLQDLVYVKKYIDKKQEDHVKETEAEHEQFLADIDNRVQSAIDWNLNDMHTSINNIVDGTTAVENSKHINNLEIKDVNGVLKIGNLIIPQKKLLCGTTYSNDSMSNSNDGPLRSVSIPLSETVKAGDVLEIHYCLGDDSADTAMKNIARIKVGSNVTSSDGDIGQLTHSWSTYEFIDEIGFTTALYLASTWIDVKPTKLSFSYTVCNRVNFNMETDKLDMPMMSDLTTHITAVYKVIE